MSERQCFLIDPQWQAIGTATAWFDHDYRGGSYGRVHWVAIVPEMQGRGLAKPLLTAVCERLRELGHERAYLTTQPERVRAISLYLRFGFVPEVRNSGDREAWKRVEMMLGRRVLNA